MGTNKTKKSEKIVKGMPSAVLLSILIHAALFVLAGLLVVFTVTKINEPEFEAPKAVERPKMKLRKPKVQLKKNAKPKSTTRIVTKANRDSMPDMQLPEMSGMGTGLGGGLGDGFDMMDFEELASPFGDKITTGSDLEGYFYNFNRDFSGRKTPMSPDELIEVLYAFMDGGWKPSKLMRYYRSQNPLYTPTICVPTVMSELAPAAFGMHDAEGYCWGVLYKGKLVYPEDIKFRFWGVGDKLMAVNVEGETVLFCAYRSQTRQRFSSVWQSNDPKDNTYYFGEHRARPSDWITLKANEPKDIQILMVDTDGGLVYHILSVEVENQKYPLTRAGGGPTFDVFRTGEISQDMRDEIYSNLYPGDVCLTNGPIFRDYLATPAQARPEVAATPGISDATDVDKKDGMRIWTLINGKTIEGELQSVVKEIATLKTPQNKRVQITINELSPEDQQYIEYALPPQLSINFTANSTHVPNPPLSEWLGGSQRPLQIYSYTFGVEVKQGSTKPYDHSLTIEYFAVGKEVDGKNYVLLDRNISSFTPTRENKKTHEFRGGDIDIRKMAYRGSAPMRGTEYSGYLVTVTDERGVVIQHKTTDDFLFENLENLKKLNRRNHFNKACIRVMPARPNEDSRGPGAINGA